MHRQIGKSMCSRWIAIKSRISGDPSYSYEILVRLNLAENPEGNFGKLMGNGEEGHNVVLTPANAVVEYGDAFADGVCFVPLASLQSVEAIVPTVAQAVGLAFYEGSEPREQLVDYLCKRNLLIVMDGFERLLHGSRPAQWPTRESADRLSAVASKLSAVASKLSAVASNQCDL